MLLIYLLVSALRPWGLVVERGSGRGMCARVGVRLGLADLVAESTVDVCPTLANTMLTNIDFLNHLLGSLTRESSPQINSTDRHLRMRSLPVAHRTCSWILSSHCQKISGREVCSWICPACKCQPSRHHASPQLSGRPPCSVFPAICEKTRGKN